MLNSFIPPSFGEKIDGLLWPLRLNELCFVEPNLPMRGRLAGLSVEQLFENKIADRAMASACLAGLWLYHDFFDESHSISQEISTIEGSYWHAILHRREPDYVNAKYWFRRVGDHTIGSDLTRVAKELAQGTSDPASQLLLTQSSWDSFRFVDFCEAAATGRASGAMLCRQIQQREWWGLFGYCFQRACSPGRPR
ncbi:MAG TPA: hypothetical protein VNH11_20660 [Pirellulales bacterium]|nr:hypothetical protein [Pirellulales bacterium]